jgi:hypothetical protein
MVDDFAREVEAFFEKLPTVMAAAKNKVIFSIKKVIMK